jgi:hypothetical protein
VRRFLTGSAFLALAWLTAASGLDSRAADPVPDSPGAKVTREKKLKAKISVDSSSGSGMSLREIIEEIVGEVRGAKAGTLRIKPDPKAGITLTTRIKFKSDKETVEEVLDKMFKASGRPWGYYVNVSAKKDDQDDGAIIIVADENCRGYPPGDPRNKKSGDAKEKDEPKKKDKK